MRNPTPLGRRRARKFDLQLATALTTFENILPHHTLQVRRLVALFGLALTRTIASLAFRDGRQP
jgi:hypothetical protein